MKNQFKIILFLVSVFLMISCGSKEFFFKENNILLNSNIKEKHKFKKEKYFKFKQSINTKSWNDLELEYYAKVKFSKKKYKSYNFDISTTSFSIAEYKLGDGDTLYFIGKKIKMTRLYNSDSILNHVFYEGEKKIKNGFLTFRCYTKDSIDINFLNQKFNEIEIIEK